MIQKGGFSLQDLWGYVSNSVLALGSKYACCYLEYTWSPTYPCNSNNIPFGVGTAEVLHLKLYLNAEPKKKDVSKE